MKCNSFGCFDTPEKQCESCNETLLCIKCCYPHFNKHFEQNTQCVFGKIRVGLSKTYKERLKSKIKEHIRIIKGQKKNIIVEAFKSLVK